MSRAPTLLLLLALQGSAWAGPVPAAEAAPTAEAAPAAVTLPGLPGPGLGEGLAAQPAAGAASAAPATSDSELAAQMLKEADAGAVAAEATHAPRRDGTRTKAQPASDSADVGQVQAKKPANKAGGDPWELRDMGKAAVQWVKDSLPWLTDNDSAHDGSPQLLGAADWSAPALAGGGAREGRPGASQLPHAAPSSDLTTGVGYGGSDKRSATGSGQNLVHAVVEALREVLAHPMTWLVAALFVVGGIVVKKIDRRPK